MKIVIFSDTYLPQINGVAISTATLVNELEKLGHDVIVVGPRVEEARRSTKKVWRFRSITYPFQKEYRLISPLSRKLRRFRRMTFDVLHVQTPFSLGHLGQYLGWKYQIPVVHTYHTFWKEYAHYLPLIAKLPESVVDNINNLLFSKRFSNRCQHIVAPSSQMKRHLEDYGVNVPITVLPTGIELSHTQSQTPNELRAKYGYSTTDSVLIFVGRLGIEKNIYFLVDCFEKLQHSLPNLKLLMVGDGPERDNLTRYIQKKSLQSNIVLTGYIENKQVFPLFAMSDVIVFPSKTETQGLSLLEGLSCGKPAVCIKAMGVEDVLEGERGGFLTEDTVDAYCEKVEALLTDKNLYQQKAKEARERAEQFSATNMAKQMERVYEQAILRKAEQRKNKTRKKTLKEMFKGSFWQKLLERINNENSN